ncbi:helix-turn-helix domain-containing protein [Micromonospora sp. SCSIO 07396]
MVMRDRLADLFVDEGSWIGCWPRWSISRHGLTHDVIAAWFGVHRSTISRSITEIRPLLAKRGCRVRDGVRLRTLSDVVAHLGHHPQALMDAIEVRVRRPAAQRAGTASCPARPD